MMNRCSQAVFGDRVHNWRCTRKGTIERDGKWYCRQHDPEEMKARREKRDAALRTLRQAEDRVLAKAETLTKHLGCGKPFYEWPIGPRKGGYRPALVVPFEDVERLIAMREMLEFLTQPVAGVFPDLVSRIETILQSRKGDNECTSTR